MNGYEKLTRYVISDDVYCVDVIARYCIYCVMCVVIMLCYCNMSWKTMDERAQIHVYTCVYRMRTSYELFNSLFGNSDIDVHQLGTTAETT